jgi:hypothetical protein
MDAIALHLEVRNAIGLADELGRHEHGLGNDDLAGYLAAIRTVLDEIEREVGRSHARRAIPSPVTIAKLERAIHLFRSRTGEVVPSLRGRFTQLLASLERVLFAELRPSAPTPTKPLFGVLPLQRRLPQDAHSVFDYLSAGAYLLSAGVARTPRGRAVGLLLGGAVLGVSLFTDARLSAAKKLALELHEINDHASSVAAAAAPFLLGYAKRDRAAATIQIVTGLCGALVSLLTDYRAARGVTRAVRGSSGPGIHGFRRRSEAPRPLEGFSAPSVIPRIRL